MWVVIYQCDLCGQSILLIVSKNLDRYYKEADMIILVVDVTSIERFSEFEDVFSQISRESELEETPILIIGNKSDSDSKIDLHNLNNVASMKFTTLQTSAKSGEGLPEVLKWIHETARMVQRK